MFTRTVLNSSQVQGWGISLASWPVYLPPPSPYSFLRVIPVVGGDLIMLHLGTLSFFILSVFMVLQTELRVTGSVSCLKCRGHSVCTLLCLTWKANISAARPSHGPGCYSSASCCWNVGSVPDQSKQDLWWLKWHHNRFYSQYFCFPLSASLLQCCILSHSSVVDTVRSLQLQQH